MVLDKFNFAPEFPLYYPCGHPLIYTKLRHQGKSILLSVLASLDGMAIPSYFTSSNGTFFSVDRDFSQKLLKEPGLSHLGIGASWLNFDSFSDGLIYLSDQLKCGYPVIVGGTPYFLPHFQSYYRRDSYVETYNPQPPLGIANHFILVYGLDRDRVHIFDPTPHRVKGTISLSDFEGFWGTDRNLPGLEDYPGISELQDYGVVKLDNVIEIQVPDIKLLTYQAINLSAQGYLDGKTMKENEGLYIFGWKSSERLLNDLCLVLERPNLAPMFENCLLWSQHSRLYLRDVLADLVKLGDMAFANHYKTADRLATVWRDAYVNFGVGIRQNSPSLSLCVGEVCNSLRRALHDEKYLHEALLGLIGRRIETV